MSIINDLGNLIEREVDDEEIEDIEDEETPSIKKIANKAVEDEEGEEKSSGSAVGEILKHIDAVKAAVEFIDKLTTDEGNTTAFEAEVALRRAIDRMQDLSDESYKNKSEKE